MSDDLFPDLPPVLSPRLKWLEEKGVKTGHRETLHLPWEAWIGEYPVTPDEVIQAASSNRLTCALTEDEAVASLAERNGWKLWNEDYDASKTALETIPDHGLVPCPVCKHMVYFMHAENGSKIGHHRRHGRECKGTGRVV